MKMKFVGITIAIAIATIAIIGIITYDDDSVLMKTDTGIVIETNSDIKHEKIELITESLFEAHYSEKDYEFPVSEELPIKFTIEYEELPISEELPVSEELPISEELELPEPEPEWTIPVKKTTQTLIEPLVEPIHEIKKTFEEPKELQPISKSDITLNPMMIPEGFYSIHNSNPDQAIDGVIVLHIEDTIPLIYKNIRIQPDSTYYGNTKFYVNCGGWNGYKHEILSCYKITNFAFHDKKIPPMSTHPISIFDWLPLNQCEDCNNNIFQDIYPKLKYEVQIWG